MLKRIKREISYNLGLEYAPFPRWITMGVNYDCMLRCKMCQMWSKDFKKLRIGDNKVLTHSEIEKVLDELSCLGVKNILFCGGEPFLRRELIEIIQYSKSKGLYASVISNGFLINHDLAEKIVLSNMDTIGISLDGSRSDVHDSIRGVKGTFDRVVSGIRFIKEQKKRHNCLHPDIFIHCTVTSRNFWDLPDMVYLARSLGIQNLEFSYLSTVNKETVEWTNQMMGEIVAGFHTFVDIPQSYLLTEDQIDNLEKIIGNIKQRAGNEVECKLDPLFLTGNKERLQKGTFEVWKCKIPWDSAVITPVGDVVPCAMFTEYKIGNLKESTFREIWNNERARYIRKLLGKSLPPICQKCCVMHSTVPPVHKRLFNKFQNIFMIL